MYYKILVLFAIITAVLSEQSTWVQTQTTLQQSRYGAAVAVTSQYVLFAGGWTGFFSTDSIEVFSIDGTPESSYSVKLSAPRMYLTGAALGTMVFFAGGKTGSTIVDIIQTADFSMTSQNLSFPRVAPEITVVGQKVFFTGGGSPHADYYDAVTGQWGVEVFSWDSGDTIAATNSEKAIFASGSQYFLYDSSNNTWDFYISQFTNQLLDVGFAGNAIVFYRQDLLEIVFSPSQVVTRPLPTIGRTEAAFGTTTNKVWIAGGRLPSGDALTRLVEFYDVVYDIWGSNELINNRTIGTSTQVGDCVLFIGGQDIQGTNGDTDIYDDAGTHFATNGFRGSYPAFGTIANKIYILAGGEGATWDPSSGVDILEYQKASQNPQVPQYGNDQSSDRKSSRTVRNLAIFGITLGICLVAGLVMAVLKKVYDTRKKRVQEANISMERIPPSTENI